jgi:hypothetical protein
MRNTRTTNTNIQNTKGEEIVLNKSQVNEKSQSAKLNTFRKQNTNKQQKCIQRNKQERISLQ